MSRYVRIGQFEVQAERWPRPVEGFVGWEAGLPGELLIDVGRWRWTLTNLRRVGDYFRAKWAKREEEEEAQRPA